MANQNPFSAAMLDDRLRQSAQSPMFNMGLGLLGSRYDGSNPFTNMMSGLSSSIKEKAGADERDRMAQERRRMEKHREQMANIIRSVYQYGAAPGRNPFGAVRPQMSPANPVQMSGAPMDPATQYINELSWRMQGFQ